MSGLRNLSWLSPACLPRKRVLLKIIFNMSLFSICLLLCMSTREHIPNILGYMSSGSFLPTLQLDDVQLIFHAYQIAFFQFEKPIASSLFNVTGR